MADKVYGFDEEGFRRVQEATRLTLGTARTGSQRRRQPPVVGGGDAKCPTVWEFRVFGNPSGGTYVMDVVINTVNENVTLNWNSSAADALTAFEGHSEIASGDIAVIGGPWPTGALYVVFLSSGDLAGVTHPLPLRDTNSLTGGTTPYVTFAYMTAHNWEA